MRQTTSEPATMQRQTGFTLIEMVVAITLLAILSMVAVPMFQLPMRAYLDATMRADLAAEMDLAASKIRDDFARAVPGTVRQRTVGNRVFIEFLRYRAMGRYRNAVDALGLPLCPAVCSGVALRDVMQFATPAENCLASIGPLEPPGATPVVGADYVVVNPMSSTGNAYTSGAATGGAKSLFQQLVTSPLVPEVCLRMQANAFPLPVGVPLTPPALVRRNFYVVETPVVYECNRTTGQLLRRWGYPVAVLVPTAYGAAPSALLSTHVSTSPTTSGCVFTMSNSTLSESRQIAVMRVQFSATSSGTGAPELVEANWQFSVSESP